jgi:hypothetical protein
MEQNEKRAYAVRGLFCDSFMKDLPCYNYLIEYASKPTNELDIQFRGGYLNIYYKGGNLMRLKGKSSCEFDEKYFYLPSCEELRITNIERLCHKDYKTKCEESPALKLLNDSVLEEYRVKAIAIKKDLSQKKAELIKRFKVCQSKQDLEKVITEMKGVMDDWNKNLRENGWSKAPTKERTIQHYISLYNKTFSDQNDFIVLDIEYALSAHATYAKKNIDGKSQPRIDILAIGREGQLYVMELKYGTKSTENKSGIAEHKRDFNETVGNENNWRKFMKDVQVLFDEKKKQKVIANDVELLKENKPVFAFVLKKEKEEDEKGFKKKLEVKDLLHVPTIYLSVDEDDKHDEPGYKLSNSLMKSI